MCVMKKFLLMMLLAGMAALPAKANPYWIYIGAVYAWQFCSTYGVPLVTMTGYGIAHTPSIHLFGTEKTTVGLDWASLASRSRNVYGLQMSIFGGAFAEDLYGVQMSLLASGWVDGYDTSRCRMNGIQFAPFAVKTTTVNGFQICPFYAKAQTVNGFQTGGIYSEARTVHGIQCGIVNIARRVDGLQIGVYNGTALGYCMQLGLINYVKRKGASVLPLLNFSFR